MNLKKLQIFVVLAAFTTTVNAQNLADSTQKQHPSRAVFNWKSAPVYARTMPFGVYTGQDKLRDKVAQYAEIGKSFDMLDIGVAVGRNQLRPDSTTFAEFKVTMDVANYGIFANEMTIGAGMLFRKPGNALMLELSYNIMAQISDRVGVGLSTGYYDFSNENFDMSRTYYGIVVRWGLQRTDAGGIVGRRPARQHGGKARGGHR